MSHFVAVVVSERERSFPLANAACIAGASTVIFGVLPILLGLFAEQLRLDGQQLAWLAATQQAGSLAGTLVAYRIVEWRAVKSGILLGACSAVIFSLFTAWTQKYSLLLCWQVLAGAGAGCVFAIGTYMLGRTAAPERSFSIMFGVQVACSCVYAALLPVIRLYFGYGLAVSSVALWFVAIVGLALCLPPAMSSGAGCVVSTPRSPAGRSAGLCALLAVGAFEIAVVAIWVFSERIGAHAGLAAGQIGAAIAIGALGGLPAGGLGSVLGNRLGHLPSLLLASSMVVVGALLIVEQTTFGGYVAGQLVLNFAWILGLSYYSGLTAALDCAGRAVRLVPATIIIAAGVGPACVSLFSGGRNLAALVAISACFCGVALALALLAIRLGKASGTVSNSNIKAGIVIQA
jgi:hypothetical protein